jgi:predicted deacylase
MKKLAKDYFPKNYEDSRNRFAKALGNVASPCEKGCWHVHSKKATDLFVDHAYLPPLKEPKKLLVLISGIHGSETYAGAAILNLFLEEILPTLNRNHLGIFIVHAMNPYGFKHHQRTTENNVNLNRNFSVSGELFKSKNEKSKLLHEKFISRRPVTDLRSRLLEVLQVNAEKKVYFGETSLDDFIKATSPGQFEREHDLEYGGQKTEPQTQALIDKMKELMPAYKDVIALDLHTGLGHRGRLHLLTDGVGRSLNPALFSEVFKHEEDKKFYEFTPAETEGFYPVHGATNSMFRELAKDSQRVCAVTLEFGTLGHSADQQIADLNQALIALQGHHYGYATPALKEEVEALNFERSYPDDDQWRKDVLTAAEGLLLRVLSRFQV